MARRFYWTGSVAQSASKLVFRSGESMIVLHTLGFVLRLCVNCRGAEPYLRTLFRNSHQWRPLYVRRRHGSLLLLDGSVVSSESKPLSHPGINLSGGNSSDDGLNKYPSRISPCASNMALFTDRSRSRSHSSANGCSNFAGWPIESCKNHPLIRQQLT